VNEFFLDAGRLATALTQVIQLGTANVAAAFDFDAGDQGAVCLKGSLDAFSAGDLAKGKTAVETAIALGDDNALIGLHPLATALDYIDADDHGVARRELRYFFTETSNFFLLQDLDQIHKNL
jgi:hypothetical protein